MSWRGQQVQRVHRDARGLHVHDDHRDALVLGGVGVGAHREPAVVGVRGERGPHLLAVDDVLVTVANGPGLQRGQVGAGLRLGVADAEVQVAGEDLGQEEVLLLVRAELHDRRAHGVDREHGHRGAHPHGLVEEDELLDLAAALAAVLLGPADAQPAVGRHLLDHLAGDGADAVLLVQLRPQLVGQEPVVVLTELVPEGLLLLRVGDVHGSPCDRPDVRPRPCRRRTGKL